MKSPLALSVIVGASLFGKGAHADDVVWNFNDQAAAAGTGCTSAGPAPSAHFVAAGPEVAVLFSGMGIELDQSQTTFSTKLDCSVRIPLLIATGNYVATLSQQLYLGISKSAGSSGGITMKATFFNAPAASMSLTFPHGQAASNPLLVAERVSEYRVQDVNGWCGSRAAKGYYVFKLEIDASRDSEADHIMLRIDGADIRFSASAAIRKCGP